jgi:hypothetical protein
MTTHLYTFWTDPGHGWLEVPLQELDELGITDTISHYSFMDQTCAYLEEDCDAPRFAQAWKKAHPDANFSALLQEQYREKLFVRFLRHTQQPELRRAIQCKINHSPAA